jgi:omega-6 fatty acid desaturase (delta-12 desaturase)
MPTHRAEGAEDGTLCRSWSEILAPYTAPENWRGLVALSTTGVPFLALLAVMLYGLSEGVWCSVLLAAPAAALLVRLFTIQHDCGHGSFFRSRRANALLGRVLGLFTLTPYAFWRRDHAVHHATSGNLERRGVGDITTLTVREYLSLPRLRRLLYRAYRNPIVLFGIGPAYQFLLRHRIPTGHPWRQRETWISVLGTNAALAAIVAALGLTFGFVPLVVGYLPVIVPAATAGVWLFYVQHQFENTYWESDPRWDFHAAAIEGCSFYDLPRVLHWLTGHIGFHHIHHLSTKVPSYRLYACFKENPELWRAKRLSLWQSLKCPMLALWDEETRQMVTFGQVRRMGRLAAA